MSKKNCEVCGVFLYACFLILNSSGCSTSPQTQNDEDRPIEISAILSISGRYSVIDEPTRKAIQFFVDNFESTSGTEFHLDIYDAGSDPVKAVEKLEEAWRGTPPQILLLSTSAIAMAIAPHIRNREVLVIANAGHPDLLSSGNDYTFSTFPDIADECGLFLQHISRISMDTVFLLHTGDVYHQADAAYLRDKLGRKVVGDEQYQVGTTDFGGTVNKINRSDAKILVLFGFGISYPSIFAELERRDFTGQILVDTDFLYNDFSKYSSEMLARTTFVGPQWIQKPPVFLGHYEESVGEPIRYFATFILDGLRLAMEAADSGKSTPPEMADYILGVQNKQMLSSRVSVTADRHFRYEMELYCIKDGNASKECEPLLPPPSEK